MKKFTPGEWVVLATIGGPQYGKVVTGSVSRAGRVKVRKAYGPAPITGFWFGAPVAWHLNDMTAVAPAEARRLERFVKPDDR